MIWVAVGVLALVVVALCWEVGRLSPRVSNLRKDIADLTAATAKVWDWPRTSEEALASLGRRLTGIEEREGAQREATTEFRKAVDGWCDQVDGHMKGHIDEVNVTLTKVSEHIRGLVDGAGDVRQKVCALELRLSNAEEGLASRDGRIDRAFLIGSEARATANALYFEGLKRKPKKPAPKKKSRAKR